LIEPSWETELYGYMWGKARALECIPYAINGMADHTHVVISIPPKLALSTLVGQLKGASSHRVNTTFVSNQSFAWQTEYGAFTVSEKALPGIVSYVKNQKRRHAESTLIDMMEDFDQAPAP